MDFWERMKGAIDKGVEGSRDLFGKARERAKDLGERGVIRFEIMQLESQAEKQVAKLGSVVYEELENDPDATISSSSDSISAIINEIRRLRTRIEEKEAVLNTLDEQDDEGQGARPTS